MNSHSPLYHAKRLNFLRTELKKFDHISFDEASHKYFWGLLKADKPFKYSVTAWPKRYEDEFNSEFWSKKKAPGLDIDPEQLKQNWENGSKNSMERGNRIHKILETILPSLCYRPDSAEEIKSEKPVSARLKQSIFNYLEYVNKRYIVLAVEKNIGDIELSTAGKPDVLYYDLIDDCVVIADHKSFEVFIYKKNFNYKGVLRAIDKSHFSKCSIQLNFYEYILRKNTAIKKFRREVNWFPRFGDNYKIIEIPDWQEVIRNMIADSKRIPGR